MTCLVRKTYSSRILSTMRFVKSLLLVYIFTACFSLLLSLYILDIAETNSHALPEYFSTMYRSKTLRSRMR